MPEKKTKAIRSSSHVPSAGPTGRSLFLGIGINEYQHFGKLNNAVKDINDVVSLLEERYELDEKILLLNEKATKDNITNQLEDLVDLAAPEDKVIIYYSGHGILRENTGYWVPVDGEPGRFGRFIRNEVIRGCIKDIRARHILLISDSCFSGALIVERDIANPDPSLAMAEWEKDRSRWVLSSGRQTEKVADGIPGENSPFATSILKVLRDNQQRELNVAAMADWVAKHTRYNWEQMPQSSVLYGAGHDGGQYVFRLKVLTPGWMAAWEHLQTLPQNTIHEINTKITEIFEYTEQFESAENIDEAYELGAYLEQKRDFYIARSSLFKLKRFAHRNTPFQAEARRLIEEMKKGLEVSSEFAETVEQEEELNPPGKSKAAQTPSAEKKPVADGETGQFTDPRDGQTYKTIRLNGKTWLTQNLNFDVGEGCWFHGDDPKNGEKYGRLYTWEAAKKACPPGWRLPTDEEWKSLANSFGGYYDFNASKDVGDPKKSYKALLADEDGRNGFAALLGGNRDPDGTFNGLGSSGLYWSGTEKDAQYAWLYIFSSHLGKLFRYDNDKAWGFSCRCLKD